MTRYETEDGFRTAGDYFIFAIERTARLDRAAEGAVVRYRVRADVAGRRFDDAIIAIGFGDLVVVTPDILLGSPFLAFAGIEPIAVPVLPLEEHIAEKVHAYTRTYEGGREGTRVKDLVDLAIMRSAAVFEARRLQSAMRQTFAYRGTHALPSRRPPPPPSWTTPYRRMAVDIGIEPSVASGHRRVAELLDPLSIARLQTTPVGTMSRVRGRSNTFRTDEPSRPRRRRPPGRPESGRDGAGSVPGGVVRRSCG